MSLSKTTPASGKTVQSPKPVLPESFDFRINSKLKSSPNSNCSWIRGDSAYPVPATDGFCGSLPNFPPAATGCSISCFPLVLHHVFIRKNPRKRKFDEVSVKAESTVIPCLPRNATKFLERKQFSLNLRLK